MEAHRGTLFLDEIDSLPLELQTKLLLFFDNREIRPVGGGHWEKSDLLLIVATGQNLDTLVEEKRMRRDLFYRLSSGLHIKIPPLRQKPEKIITLVTTFAEANGITIPQDLIDFYSQQGWPGNIRQLMGHLKRKKILSPKTKWHYDLLDKSLFQTNAHFKEREIFVPLDQLKREYAHHIFHHFQQKHKAAADALGISPLTLKSYLTQKAS